MAELLASLSRCVELLGKDCLGPHGLEEAVTLLDKTMVEHFKRAEERAGNIMTLIFFVLVGCPNKNIEYKGNRGGGWDE